MDKEILRRLQMTEKEVMDEVVRLCEEHDLSYFLVGGTLLGAVRYQGFIPWDDDIDLAMPRQDYDAFKEICKTELGTSYFLQDYDTDPNDYLPYINIIKKDTIMVQAGRMKSSMKNGIGVDIFPINYVAEQNFEDSALQSRIREFDRLTSYVYYKQLYEPSRAKGGRWFKKSGRGHRKAAAQERAIGMDGIKQLREDTIRGTAGANATHGIILGTPNAPKKDFHEMATFFPAKKLVFEGREYSVPGKWEVYLEQLYGEDYRQEPLVVHRQKHSIRLLSFSPEEGLVEDEKLQDPGSMITPENLRRLQLVELDMISEIDRICQKHGLRYYLCGGSLLGAVRHKGFIPWDDDLDISMPREDLDKFKEICKTELDAQYFFQDQDSEGPEYFNYFPRIRKKNTLFELTSYQFDIMHKGIFMDIFPLDNVKTDANRRLVFRNRLFFAAHQRVKENYRPPEKRKGGSNLGYYVFAAANRIFGETRLKKYRESLARRDNDKDTEYYAVFGTHHGVAKEIFRKDVFDPPQRIEFEGRELNAPNHWNVYLSRLFGNNFMQLPPESGRTGHKIMRLVFDKEEGDVVLDNPKTPLDDVKELSE